METWFVILVSLCVVTIIKLFMLRRRDGNRLPPGPSFLSSHILLLTNSLLDLQTILRNLKFKYGPLVTISLGSHPLVFVGSHSLTHQILIKEGAFFSDRPKVFRFCSIFSTSFGPTWRILRRNLASEFLHPSRVKSYFYARKRVLRILIGRLQEHHEAVGIKVTDHFEHAMLSLSVSMCFGDELDDLQINDIMNIHCRLLSFIGSRSFILYIVSPRLWKILFKKKWKNFKQLRNDQKQIFISLIKSRTESAKSESQSVGDKQIVAYIDTLVKLRHPEEEATKGNGGKLTQKEMVSLCGEFLNVGTGATSTALQWIIANLVKQPRIQSKLYDEIISVVGTPPPPGVESELFINEEDLKKMPYLKAVVLEGLRRHPPGHMVVPHRVMKDVEVQGYTIPQGATINFMVSEMGWDPNVWADPMEFKPERFLLNDGTTCVFDITGRKGIKMMPFGVGRRICPGSHLALLHLEYFVANLIWYFHWTSPDGCHVDLSENVEFTVVMKNPLKTQIIPRAK